MLGAEAELVLRGRWDSELAPHIVNVGLRVVQACVFLQMLPGRRPCTVSAEEQIKGDLFARRPLLIVRARVAVILEPGNSAVEVETDEFVVEEKLHVWVAGELVE